MTAQIALYGATGTTGALVLDRALAAGLRPKLIGRDAARLRAIANGHGLETASADLGDPAALDAALRGVDILLHVAGPFVATAPAMLDACARADCDYLDMSGELAGVELVLARAQGLAAKGLVAVAGVGFGIAASDALVAQIAARLGRLDSVRISVAAASAFTSKAVAQSTLSVLAGGGAEVIGGRIQPSRLASRRWSEALPDGSRTAFASAPLADLAGAIHAGSAARAIAGVPMAPGQARMVHLIAPLMPLLTKTPLIRDALANTGGHGAHVAQALVSRIWVHGRRDAQTAALLLEGGEGFALAADIAVHALLRHAKARPKPGAHTPASAYGATWINDLFGLHVRAIESDGDL